MSALSRRSIVSLGDGAHDASPSPCAHVLAADLDGDASDKSAPSETLERLSSALLLIQSELSSDASPWRSAHASLALSGRLHGNPFRQKKTFPEVAARKSFSEPG